MIPSRYLIIDEKSPYPLKRRVRGQRDDKGNEPAITLLPPDPYMIMERPNYVRSSSPAMYRTAPPKSAKNKEASSFVILGDTIRTPVQSRPGSPSGRVSPFRGHGFKSPSTTRPNSRAPSPSDSPRKQSGTKPVRNVREDRPRVSRDIGLPPKSPMKGSGKKGAAKTTKTDKQQEKPEEDEKNKEETELKKEDVIVTESGEECSKETTKDEENQPKPGSEPAPMDDSVENKEETKETSLVEKKDTSSEKETKDFSSKEKETLAVSKGEKEKHVQEAKKIFPLSPTPRAKTKTEKNETNAQQKQTTVKKSAKPPIPPKKIGLKTTLKADEGSGEQNKKNAKGKPKEITKEKEKSSGKEMKTSEKKPEIPKKPETPKKPQIELLKTESETPKTVDSDGPKISLGDKVLETVKKPPEGDEGKKTGSTDKPKDVVPPKQDTKPKEVVTANKQEGSKPEDKQTEKLVPCFQPDKCHLAPPTMASPSPIITPTISTPSTSAELSSNSMKNSQSIAAAPTTVTSSSLSSVSSTVVLTGNLARREIENRGKSSRESANAIANPIKSEGSLIPEVKGKSDTADESSSAKIVTSQMVKASSKDSIKWSKKDNLSGEITSATKVIKAEPDMEVLSPNNLRDSPPRRQAPNLAWEEDRMPNGDVPNKVETQGKFRRFISAIWRFLTWFFCCGCLKGRTCCRKPGGPVGGQPKASLLSRLKCCGGNKLNPFKCCCKTPKCCEGKQCCGKKKSKTKPKSKPNSKSKKCCAKPNFTLKGCCDSLKTTFSNSWYKLNSGCRSLFCLNMMCCQNMLRKCTCCHKLKCCQKNGFCSCWNPNVKREPRKLHKKGSRASNNSKGKDQLDVVLVEHTSMMKAAIPVLPTCLAVLCMTLNLFLPGVGTFLSGLLCLCFGKPRFSTKDTPKNRMGSFIVNTIIGVAQLFTVIFCLVGWGWSIWWGIIMYKLSRRQKRIKMAEKSQKEAEAAANVNQNHVDVEQG